MELDTGNTKELGLPNCHMDLFNFHGQMYFRFSDVATVFGQSSHVKHNGTKRLEKYLKENGKCHLTFHWEYSFFFK